MVFVKRTYTAEQVKLALRVYHSVQSFRRAFANTGIPKSTIHRWTCRLGRVIDWNKTKKRRITRCNARFDSCHQVLLDLLRGCPFKPLKTLQCELHARNINLSISTLHRYIRTLNYTYQKISWRKPPRDVSCEKKSFWRELRSVLNEGRNVLSVDEAGFLTNDLPLRGYGLRGQRLCAVKQHPKRFKASTIMAISRFAPPLSHTVSGNVNGTIFRGFMQHVFAQAPSGTVALLDNISFHKSSEVKTLADRYGVRILFTPPYSPECNPVENYFSVLKNGTRREAAVHIFHTQDDFTDMVKHVISHSNERQRFQNYFQLP